jgi:hypothetical protein
MGTIQSINSDDHIVKIKPSEDVVLALDSEGNELCKLEFEVKGTRIRFNTPVLNKHPQFAIKLAQLFSYLSQHSGQLSMVNPGEKEPDLVKLYKDPDHNPVWKKLSAIAITSRPVVLELVFDIFFNYLDGYIVDIEYEYPKVREKLFFKREMDEEEKSKYRFEKQKEWFGSHVRIDSVQRIFSACLAVDDMIKKNATFVLEKEMGIALPSTAQSSEDISAAKQGSTLKSLTPTRPYSFGQL